LDVNWVRRIEEEEEEEEEEEPRRLERFTPTDLATRFS
jgi:hypothetical protein